MKTTLPKNIDEYIASFPANVQERLELLRSTIKKCIPGAEEAIKYAMPTIMLKGRNLVHFAAFANHIGFYAVPATNEKFRKELSVYKTGKGSIQFPLDQPMPLDLISRMTTFRLQNAMEKAPAKAPRK